MAPWIWEILARLLGLGLLGQCLTPVQTHKLIGALGEVLSYRFLARCIWAKGRARSFGRSRPWRGLCEDRVGATVRTVAKFQCRSTPPYELAVVAHHSTRRPLVCNRLRLFCLIELRLFVACVDGGSDRCFLCVVCGGFHWWLTEYTKPSLVIVEWLLQVCAAEMEPLPSAVWPVTGHHDAVGAS